MIQLTHLNFAYPKKGVLFRDLNLGLTGENIYGLLGKNGAGKTTLLKIISGLLFPNAGDCRVLGFKSSKRDPELLTEIFFITEEFSVPPLTIKEYQALYAPFYPRFKALEFQSYLEEFSISAQDKLTRLSYGQKKKFLIAFGLATDSRILILDEPTNGLDIPSKSQFRKLLASTIGPDRIFLISTHQVRDMQQLIDPVLILDNGTIIFQHSMTEVNEKLNVQLVKEEPDPEQALFYEKVIGGYSLLGKDEQGLGAGVDLEILFNAVIKNREKINAIFDDSEVQGEAEKNNGNQ
ncbi:MAG TPA: ABC transporter ATP-binding protein [Bacillota bacterium]|nr:ABC transporter ATP-binding protein [Bacillota bacterium]